MVDDAFRILADPTRRKIMDLLAEQGELTVGQLAAEFPELVSSGISKHLMAMRASGMVTSTKRGRNQYYRIDGDAFSASLGPWIARYEKYWDGQLATLKELAESGQDPGET